MIGMVLAAGLGTRLRPLTERTPKPALPLLGSTLLAENLALLARLGVEEVVVNAHHLPHLVAAAAKEAANRLGLRLHLSFESPQALGTGGALVAARPLLDRGETVILINGDVLTDIDLLEAKAAHEQGGAAATMVLLPMPEGADFAPVETDDEGRVVRIAGQGRGAGAPHLFAGIHFLEREVFDVLPTEGPSCVNRQGHIPLIQRGETIRGFLAHGGRWSDVGTPERYREANLDLLDGRYRLEGFPRQEGVFVAEGAVVEAGATLEAPCWIGPGALVRSTATVGPRGIVLPDGVADGEVIDDVVLPR